MDNPCVFCHYARMRRDICGIYCVGSFLKNADGTCNHFLDHGKLEKNRKDRSEAEAHHG